MAKPFGRTVVLAVAVLLPLLTSCDGGGSSAQIAPPASLTASSAPTVATSPKPSDGPPSISDLNKEELQYLDAVQSRVPSFKERAYEWHLHLSFGRATCAVLEAGSDEATVRQLMAKDGLTAAHDQTAVLSAAVSYLCPDQQG